MKAFIIISTLSLFALACGGEDPGTSPGDRGGRTDQSGADDMGGGPGAAPDALVQGKPAAEFYADFVWHEGEGVVEGAGAFREGANGRNAYLVHVFLHPEGRFELYYAEGEGSVSATGHRIGVDPASKLAVEGQWGVEAERLVVGDVMDCQGLSVNDRPSLRCTLRRKLGSEEAVGASSVLRKSWGDDSPLDGEWAQYR